MSECDANCFILGKKLYRCFTYCTKFFLQEPRPIPAWEGILDGTRDGPACPQLNVATNKVIGQEDCLTLNVYSTNVRKPEENDANIITFFILTQFPDY